MSAAHTLNAVACMCRPVLRGEHRGVRSSRSSSDTKLEISLGYMRPVLKQKAITNQKLKIILGAIVEEFINPVYCRETKSGKGHLLKV